MATTNFFGGLLRRASNTIESSVQIATQAGSDAVHTAQNAGTTAISAVSGMVTDLGAALTDVHDNPRNPSAGQRSHGFAVITKSVKSFAIPDVVLLLVDEGLVLCSEAICVMDPDADGLGEGGIMKLPYIYEEGQRPVLAGMAGMVGRDRVVLSSLDGHVQVVSIAQANSLCLTTNGSIDRRILSDARLLFLPATDTTTPVVIGLDNGHLQMFNIEDRTRRQTFPPPALCSSSLSASVQAPAVTCVRFCSLDVDGNSQLVVGYGDGVISMVTLRETPKHSAFIAHAGAVSGILVFHSVLALSIGDALERSVAVFDVYTGRCLARRMLTYTPTSLTHQKIERDVAKGMICPSEQIFMVGGGEGELDIFRLVVLSSERVEVRLMKTLADEKRAKKSKVLNTFYNHERSVLAALSDSGDLRRWHLSRADACTIALLDSELDSKPMYTEENVLEAMDHDFQLPEGNRLDSVAGVLKAQEILANILDNASVPEMRKDDLISDFQACQANMIVTAAQADTELRRSRKRLAARFEVGVREVVKNGRITDVQLSRAAKRDAAMEIEFLSRRHAGSLLRIHKQGVKKLKSIIQGLLKSLPSGESSGLQVALRDVETLDANGEVRVS